MGLKRPFKRTVRQFTDNSYADFGKTRYIKHPDFASSPIQYIRPFYLIQEDLKNLFNFIEPADNNHDCYSYRIHELLIRSCIEIEANFKAILIENGFDKRKNNDEKANLNMKDYHKVNESHHLSSYEVLVPSWEGEEAIRTPLSNWNAKNSNPKWYDAYNSVKHNRKNDFSNASFRNLVDAVSGLVVLLSAQFHIESFSKGPDYIYQMGDEKWSPAIGEYFLVGFPTDWKENEKYDFTIDEINSESFEVEKFYYNNI